MNPYHLSLHPVLLLLLLFVSTVAVDGFVVVHSTHVVRSHRDSSSHGGTVMRVLRYEQEFETSMASWNNKDHHDDDDDDDKRKAFAPDSNAWMASAQTQQPQPQPQEISSHGITGSIGEIEKLAKNKDPEELFEAMKVAYWWPSVIPLLCGAVASGHHLHDPEGAAGAWVGNMVTALGAMALVGPCWEGFAETLNGWFLERDESDHTVNSSTHLSLGRVLTRLAILSASGVGLSLALEAWTLPSSEHVLLQLSLAFAALSVLYATPPLQLAKKGGWMGDWTAAVASTSLPWLIGYALFAQEVPVGVTILPLLYSFVGLGPAIIQDFEMTRQDPGIRLRSLFSKNADKKRIRGKKDNTSRWAAIGLQDGIQMGIALYIWFVLGEPLPAAVLAGMVFPQMFIQRSLLFSRLVDGQKAFAFNQPFLLAGFFAASYAIGNA